MALSFVLTGGGTGGHVFPALAVARILRDRGHRLLFIGTPDGMESKLVPDAGFDIHFVRSGGLNRVGIRQQTQTLFSLPGGIAAAGRLLKKFNPRAIFSTGGYAAGPVMLAAALNRTPLIVMEPNATPGFANRRIARYVYRALLAFEATKRWFPEGRAEVTGLPVRPEFFHVEPKTSGPFTLLLTGGSRGARKLNQAMRAAWPFFRASPIRVVHQTGANEYEAIARDFSTSGVNGEVVPFIRDMAEAFSQADLVLGRAGAGGVTEIAAAGMPSILVPLPFAADDHQRRNAESLVAVDAARMVLDGDLTGERLFSEVQTLATDPALLGEMRRNVKQFARPGAAERAADVMEEAAQQVGRGGSPTRVN
jgi:UDP-N-acetylglucosamine--N-acetylmuramyl-(pentapeptide) pyrophosphoryl-undecaprenol N-acetylglucosamine transferase